MNLDMIYLNIKNCHDIERLRGIATTLVKCIDNSGTGSGYCLVDEETRDILYRGDRNACKAVMGFSKDHIDNNLFLCVDVPSLMVVEPEWKFGECLGDYDG